MAKVNFAKVNFAKGSVAEMPSDAVPENQAHMMRAVAPVPAHSVPTPYSDENISLRDIILPRINIVQKVGDLSNIFEHGAILLNGEQVLYSCPKDVANQAPSPTAPTPLNILVLGFQPTRYAEKIEGGGRGVVYDTPAQVVENGGTIAYAESKATGKPLYQELATALMLIEQPDGVDAGNFPHSFGSKNYCFALWAMKGSAYTNGAKVLFTAKQIGVLRPVEKGGKGGYRAMFYTLGSRLTSATVNGKVQWYYIPVLRPGADTTPEFREWIAKDVVGF